MYTLPTARWGPSMTEKEKSSEQSIAKKPYQKPSFQYERVFETQAMSCTKLPGQMKCGTSNNKQS
jgi:hypothetical protein